MNILHTESMGVKGGEPMRVIDELLIIRELGHTPYLVCRPDTWLASEAIRKEIVVLYAPLKRAVDPTSLLLLWKYIRKYQIDIVHSHNSKDSYSALVAARLSGIAFIRARHGDLVKKPGPIYRFSNLIITTGEKIKHELQDHGIASGKIVSIPSFPPSERFVPHEERRRQMRREYAINDPSAPLIGTMTGFKPGKRPDFILEELTTLVSKYPDVRYLIAGPDKKPEYRQKIEENILRKGLQNHVRYVGFVDPASFLDAIDIYLCPSRREGLPQAVMQAMMMGKAVVSTKVGGVPYLNVEENLLLSEIDDPKELVSQLEKLLRNPELIKKLGEKNRFLALERFNRDQMKKLLKEAYEKVVR